MISLFTLFIAVIAFLFGTIFGVFLALVINEERNP